MKRRERKKRSKNETERENEAERANETERERVEQRESGIDSGEVRAWERGWWGWWGERSESEKDREGGGEERKKERRRGGEGGGMLCFIVCFSGLPGQDAIFECSNAWQRGFVGSLNHCQRASILIFEES
jgi:hypothetical protein